MSPLGLLGRAAAATRRAGLGGALRVARDAADRILLTAGRPPLRATVDGVSLHGFLRHRSFLHHLARGGYEPFSRELFLDALAGSDLVLDVGAHVGFYSLLAAGRRPDARVVAVEPDPYNAAALAANVARAGAGVEIVRRAASSRSGRSSFRQSLGTVGSSLVARPGTGPTRTIDVETTTLDELAGDVGGRTVLVKLDVEGAELDALAGLRQTAERAAALVALVELNPLALAAAGESPAALVAELERLGLHVRLVDEERHELRPLPEPPPKGNLLCRTRR